MSKNYLVTSATDGIGRSIVEKILSESRDPDDRVIVNYGHSDEKAAAFLAANQKDENKIILIKADLSSYETMLDFVHEICLKVDHLDYIVCNTGISAYGSFDDYTWEMWNKVLTTNLSIPAFLLKELKYKLAPEGSILVMGSDAGVKTYSSSVVYSVSKAGLIHLAKVLVKEFESCQVRINALAPGFIETAWQSGRTDESRERINKKIALHRFGDPTEIADMAYAVLHNTYLNGSVVQINGGYEYF